MGAYESMVVYVFLFQLWMLCGWLEERGEGLSVRSAVNHTVVCGLVFRWSPLAVNLVGWLGSSGLEWLTTYAGDLTKNKIHLKKGTPNGLYRPGSYLRFARMMKKSERPKLTKRLSGYLNIENMLQTEKLFSKLKRHFATWKCCSKLSWSWRKKEQTSNCPKLTLERWEQKQREKKLYRLSDGNPMVVDIDGVNAGQPERSEWRIKWKCEIANRERRSMGPWWHQVFLRVWLMSLAGEPDLVNNLDRWKSTRSLSGSLNEPTETDEYRSNCLSSSA